MGPHAFTAAFVAAVSAGAAQAADLAPPPVETPPAEKVTDPISMVAGYGGVDYDHGDFLFDMVEHSSIISGVVRF